MKSRYFEMSQEDISPLEQLCQLASPSTGLSIGLPKEESEAEKRFPLTPEAVAFLTSQGHHIIMQSEAGNGINYSDLHYTESGAEVTDNAAIVFQSDIILKITPPTLSEIAMMKQGASVISLLKPLEQSAAQLKVMMKKRIQAIAFDRICAADQSLPFADLIAEIDGTTSIMIAANLLSNQHGGKGILLGGIPGINPAEVLIFGSGLSGCAAARSAIGQGALVKMFDNSITGLRTAMNKVGQGLFTSNLHLQVVKNALQAADVIILASHIAGWFLCEDQIKTIKKGALIIDLCAGSGGCCETTMNHNYTDEPIFEKFGILHYCRKDISTTVARTTSIALSNLFVPVIQDIASCKNVVGYLKSDIGFRHGVYLFNGKLVNRFLGKLFNIPSYDITLFLTAF